MIDPVHEPPQDSGAQTIGALRFIGIVLGLGILFLVLMILAGVVIPLLMLNFMSSGVLAGIIGLLLTINSTLLYAALAGLMVFMKKSRQRLGVAGIVGAVIVLALVLGTQGLKMPFLWVLSPWPAIAFIGQMEPVTFFLGLLAQVAILGLLTLQLTRQLKKAGESTSKMLFAESPSLPIRGVR